MSAEFKKLWVEAVTAGNEAVMKAKVVPMVVGTPKSLFSNEIDYSQPVEVVEDGACGFAWINVKPGTSAFAKWLKAQGYARKDEYYGGVTVWVSQFNQSVQKKEAYARAVAKVLRDAGIKAYAASRLD